MLVPLAKEWENIGLCLGLEDITNSFNASIETSAASCLRETLKLWLNRVNPPPTWEELAEAVEPFDAKIASPKETTDDNVYWVKDSVLN